VLQSETHYCSCNFGIWSSYEFACRHIHEQLTHAVQQAVDQYQGSECLLLILDALQEEASKVLDEAQQHAVERSRGSQEKLEAKVRPSQIGRRSIW